MIPSLVNLTIGGMAFTRGIPWLARLLLQWIPEGEAIPDYRRPLAAVGLTTQMFRGRGSRHRGAGVPRLGPHFPCHALGRARPARHGPLGGCFRPAGADRVAFRGRGIGASNARAA
jgi:hypothetical protein